MDKLNPEFAQLVLKSGVTLENYISMDFDQKMVFVVRFGDYEEWKFTYANARAEKMVELGTLMRWKLRNMSADEGVQKVPQVKSYARAWVDSLTSTWLSRDQPPASPEEFLPLLPSAQPQRL